jgi:cell division protein FtsQ
VQPLMATRTDELNEMPVDSRRSRRLVLPRFLRRPARILARLDWSLPRHVGTTSLAVLFLTTAVAGVLIGGHGLTVASAVTVWSGLSIQEIEISGQSDASESEILDRLAIGPIPSLLTFDLDAARERVENLGWIASATLTKLYPNTLRVAITERAPFGIWQNDGALYLIDDAGSIVAEGMRDHFRDLPYVVGPGAAERISEFVALVSAEPAIGDRVRAGVLISQNRWTIILDNGIELLLPPEQPEVAMRTIAALDSEKQLLSREIVVVDFRFDQKAILRLTEAGILAREKLLADRSRRLRKGTRT